MHPYNREKARRYADAGEMFSFVPIACENMGPIMSKGLEGFQKYREKRMEVNTGDTWEGKYLKQLLLVVVTE